MQKEWVDWSVLCRGEILGDNVVIVGFLLGAGGRQEEVAELLCEIGKNLYGLVCVLVRELAQFGMTIRVRLHANGH